MVKLEIDISQLTDQERFDFINGFNSLNGVELEEVKTIPTSNEDSLRERGEPITTAIIVGVVSGVISGVIVEYLKKWIIDRPNSDVSVKGEKIHDLPEDDINNIMNKYGT